MDKKQLDQSRVDKAMRMMRAGHPAAVAALYSGLSIEDVVHLRDQKGSK